MTELDAEWGSNVATQGFENEDDVADKFRDWRNDEDAQKWLQIMGYDLEKIQNIQVENLSRNIKSDIEVTVETDQETVVEGISIKRAKESANYNQVDKRWVENYVDKWSIPDKVVEGLKMYVGREGWKPQEIEDKIPLSLSELRDPLRGEGEPRRLYFDELPEEHQKAIRGFFQDNKDTVMRDTLKGDEHPTDWILITQIHENTTEWTLRSIDNAVAELNGEFEVNRNGNIQLGKITVQRKGGDSGRETAQMLQFKMKPFDLVNKNND